MNSKGCLRSLYWWKLKYITMGSSNDTVHMWMKRIYYRHKPGVTHTIIYYYYLWTPNNAVNQKVSFSEYRLSSNFFFFFSRVNLPLLRWGSITFSLVLHVHRTEPNGFQLLLWCIHNDVAKSVSGMLLCFYSSLKWAKLSGYNFILHVWLG